MVILPHRRKAFRFVSAGGGGITYLVNQNFETATTGYDNSETWVEAGTGTIEAANTSTVIVGSQSLQINLVAQTGSTYTSFTAQSSLFVKFRFRVVSTNGGNITIATIRNGATVLGSVILVGANRTLRVNGGGVNGSSSGAGSTIDLNQNKYMWFEYVKGTGSDAIIRAGWADDDTKPSLATTTNKTATTTGTGTLDADRIYLGHSVSSTYECFYDVVQAASTAF